MSKYFKLDKHLMPDEAAEAMDKITEFKIEQQEEKELQLSVARNILGRPLSELEQELGELEERYPKDAKIAGRLSTFLQDNTAYQSAISMVTAMLSELPESLGNAVMESIILQIRSNYEVRRERARRELAKESEENGEKNNEAKGREGSFDKEN